jgi:hypothetical protein
MASTHRKTPVDDGAMAGTADYVVSQLTSSRRKDIQDRDVMALYIPKLQRSERDSLVETLERVAVLIYANLQRVHELQLEQLVDSLTPRVPPPASAIREAQMLAQARAAVIKSAEWLSAADIARNAGSKSSNPNAQTSKWKRDKKIFVITPSDGIERFPGYGLDEDHKPYPALAEVIRILSDKDGWGLAYWFASANSFLGGRTPQALLASAPEQVIAAARDAAEGIQHG